MKVITLLFILSAFAIKVTCAQEVEHNYLVGPQVTTCDSLDIQGLSEQESIEKIRNTKFRFNQAFRLTRKQGLQSGEFYSCDNEKGYLVITYNEQEALFVNINKEDWQELTSSSDPEGFFFRLKDSYTSEP